MVDEENFRVRQDVVFSWKKHTLFFKTPAKTSRDVLLKRDIWFIKVYRESNPAQIGIGECAPIWGLSCDDITTFESVLENWCKRKTIEKSLHELQNYPSIKFGVETALLDLSAGASRILYSSEFTKGNTTIPINGLIWMNSKENMIMQADEKINNGYTCIKLKIGALNFTDELETIKYVRSKKPDMEIRVDANGALTSWLDKDCCEFNYSYVEKFLAELSHLNIHSIEQPVFAPPSVYRELCEKNIIPIALDEQLIGVNTIEEKKNLLLETKPQFIVLKPTLLGGFSACEEWIKIANEQNIGWWITSALESNIGLSAIAQWTYLLNNSTHQGLGTGSLYTNNMDSPLHVQQGMLGFDPSLSWDITSILKS